MSAPTVVVLDHGSGNLRSAQRALERVGAEVLVTAEPSAVLSADGLVVPGVGAFASCMSGLTAVRAGELIGRRLSGARPVLGICVGMQVMFEAGVEHGVTTSGLGEWPGVVERLHADVLPHMGWNTVASPVTSTLFGGVESERFYFVHTYAVRHWDLVPESPLFAPASVTWAEHGEPFVAAVENGPLCAVQFHPEKSGSAGLSLLTNWVSTL
ncbi:MAG: imidazole glycerol phosphate synthase subunit HisH [Actinomycetes bacterium]